MFDNFIQARREKPRRWVGVTITVSLIVHTVAIVAAVIWSFWKIDKLAPLHSTVSFIASKVPEIPPPPAAPPPAPKVAQKTTTKIKLTELIQPPKEMPAETPEEEVVVAGAGTGVEGGVGDGVEGAVDVPVGIETKAIETNAPPPPPPPVPEKPVIVPVVMLRGNRISGNDRPSLPESVKQVMAVQGMRQATAAISLCLSAQGAPTTVTVKNSSGYPELDQKLLSEVRSWRYKPWIVNGKAVSICTFVTFNYNLTQ